MGCQSRIAGKGRRTSLRNETEQRMMRCEHARDAGAARQRAGLIELIAVRAKLRVRLRKRFVARFRRVEHDELRVGPEGHGV